MRFALRDQLRTAPVRPSGVWFDPAPRVTLADCLRHELRLTGTPGTGLINSGVQIRSLRVPGSTEMSGYQVDAGDGWWGKLYDESRRNKVIAESADTAPGHDDGRCVRLHVLYPERSPDQPQV